MTGDIHETISSLERAESGCGRLDRAIGLTVVRLPHMKGPIHVFARIDAGKIPGFDSAPFPPYTSRLDTVIGLIGILLPGWEWRLNIMPTSGEAILQAPGRPGKTEEAITLSASVFSRVEWSERDSVAYAPIAVAKAALEAACQIENSQSQ